MFFLIVCRERSGHVDGEFIHSECECYMVNKIDLEHSASYTLNLFEVHSSV